MALVRGMAQRNRVRAWPARSATTASRIAPPENPPRRPRQGAHASACRADAASTVVLRWCIVGVALFVAFLYYQPLSSYLQTRSALNERTAEVAAAARRAEHGCRSGSPTRRR